MSRLPIPGSDNNIWGNVLNDFLTVEHNSDGTLKKANTINNAEQITSKGVAGGYASLDGAGVVPVAQLGSGTASSGTYLRGNNTWGSITAPFPQRPNVAGQWALLTGRPYAPSIGTGTYTKDVWRYVPFRIETSWTIDALAINVSTAAATGTATMIFGLFAADSNNRPSTLQTDWSTFGSVDLTTTGVKTLTMTNVTLAAGDWYIGCAWSGTATPTNPVLSTFNTTVFPTIYMSSATFPASAYSQSISGASVPGTAAPTNVAAGAAIWIQMH
jgi:hypothetical protein